MKLFETLFIALIVFPWLFVLLISGRLKKEYDKLLLGINNKK